MTTNVAIFWAAGTKPGTQSTTEGPRKPSISSMPEYPTDGRKAHWENIYQSKASNEVSWFQEHAGKSMELIVRTGISAEGQIIDVGGGSSILVNDLLDKELTNITVLDLSSAALDVAKARLGEHAQKVKWIEVDITEVELPESYYDVWHDRAVFHFLMEAQDRQRYLHTAVTALKPGGYIVIATFAADGPQQCSGLATARYNSDELQEHFGNAFKLIECSSELHSTPFGTQQKFVYCLFKKCM